MASSTSLKRFVDIGKKIVCVGRNYKAHAAELGNKVPTQPLLFLKPTTAYVEDGGVVEIPPGSREVHHEVELAVVMGSRAKSVSEEESMACVAGYALALDMTARDFQDVAKSKGQPWTLAKAFDTSCPISSFVDRDRVPEPGALRLWCSVNGSTRQDGNTQDMIFSLPTLISYISGFMTLEPGDVILTGTPSGVGPVTSGDVIEAGLADLVSLKVTVK